MSVARVTFFVLLVAQLAFAANLFSVDRVPNGDGVFANGHYWSAVFNATQRGGSDTLNPFGTAFAAAGHTWSTALCNADSDADGFTNGEELGDPGCLWSVGADLSTLGGGARSDYISHPGVWSSLPTEVISRSQTAFVSCTRDPAPVANAATEMLAIRARSSQVQLPTGLVGVVKSPQFVQEFKPSADTDADWGPTVSCPYSQAGLEDWHDGSTWTNNGNAVPAAGTSVTLPDNKKILISSCSIPAEGYLKIVVPATSQLIFSDAPIALKVKDLEVFGQLWMGSAHCPLQSTVTITFAATKAESATYTNGLVAQTDGLLELHGAHHDWTWTRLKTTAVRGSRVLVVQDEVDWSIGDEVVVVTSIYEDNNDNQNEQRRIIAVDPQNKTLLMLNEPLEFDHFGGVEYQSEVGLLSRSILFRGDTSGYADSYGGHVIASAQQTTLKVSGVRGDRMGQRNVMGRYPFHLHLLVGGGNTSYMQQIACTGCYFRCAVIHGTTDSLLRKSVAFNVSGHTFYLEDGAEMRNRVEYNLAAYIHTIGTPASGGSQTGETMTASADVLQPADHTASGFYVPNPYNSVVGNAASGGWSGFSYPIFDTPITTSQSIAINPSTYPVLKFEGNTAHSSGYYWSDAGCVYFGGKLYTEDGVLKYTNGRVSHPTSELDGVQQYHNISHLRTWLCNMGYSSWGDYVEMDQYEATDVNRAAVMFGTSSMSNALIIGTSRHDPIDMRTEGRQGFQFYDTWVQTSLFNVEFRNYWTKRTESKWQRNGVIVDLTHSDIYKPWGISATKRFLASTGVDNGIVFNRWIRETGASRMFNLVDWDGSIVNSPDCSAWILGSDIDWWNAADGSCYKHVEWGVWICRRVPGREVVGLDMELPDLMTVKGSTILDVSTDSDDVLSESDRAKVNFGWMTQFGTEGESRKLRLTRNHHLATGLSGIGWYMWSSLGMPFNIEINPTNFPRGSHIVLAIGYPAGTTFEIYGENTWGTKYRLEWEEVANRDIVAQGNGSAYHFDGKNLYLKVADFWAPYPNAYSRNGVDIYSESGYGAIHVSASCSSTILDSSGTTFCAPVTFEAPPVLTAANITCDNLNLLENPSPLAECADRSNIPPNGTATCDGYRDNWRCRYENYDDCKASCGVCRRLVPYPANCSFPKACDAANKPAHIADRCTSQMNNHPVSEVCRVARCDPQTGNMKHLNQPEGTPCELAQSGGFGSCTTDAVCSVATDDAGLTSLSILNARALDDRSGTVDIQLSSQLLQGTVTSVSATCMILGAGSTETTFSLTAKDGMGWFSGVPPSGHRCARSMAVTIQVAGSADTVFSMSDWRRTAGMIPAMSVVSVTTTTAVLEIDPSDHIKSARLTFQDGSHVATTGTYSAASEAWSFVLPSGETFAAHSLAQLELTFYSTLMMNRTLPCLQVGGSAGDSCITDTTNLATQPSACRTQAIQKTENLWWATLQVDGVEETGTTVSDVRYKFWNKEVSGADAVLTEGSTTWQGSLKKMTEEPVFVEVRFADGSPSDFFSVSVSNPKVLFSLPCVNGSALQTFVPFTGVSGFCTSSYKCVTEGASVTPVPPLAPGATATPATPVPSLAPGATATPATPAPPLAPGATATPATPVPPLAPGATATPATPAPPLAPGATSSPLMTTLEPLAPGETRTPPVATSSSQGSSSTTPTQSGDVFSNTQTSQASIGLTSTSSVLIPVTVTTTGGIPYVQGSCRLSGNLYSRLLANTTLSTYLELAVRTDLSRLFNCEARFIRIDSLTLGSLVVDYTITTHSVSVFEANAAVANSEEAGGFTATQAMYANATGSSEVVTVIESSTQAGTTRGTSACGSGLSAYDCTIVLSVGGTGLVLVIVAGVVLCFVSSCRSETKKKDILSTATNVCSPTTAASVSTPSSSSPRKPSPTQSFGDTPTDARQSHPRETHGRPRSPQQEEEGQSYEGWTRDSQGEWVVQQTEEYEGWSCNDQGEWVEDVPYQTNPIRETINQ